MPKIKHSRCDINAWSLKENKCTTNVWLRCWFFWVLCTCQKESFFGFCKAISNSQQERHPLSKPRAGLCQSCGDMKGLRTGQQTADPWSRRRLTSTSSHLRKRHSVQGSSGWHHGCFCTQGRGSTGNVCQTWEAKCTSATGSPAGQGTKGLQNPCFPIWEFSFHGWPSPSPSLLLPPCNSRFWELRVGLAQKKVLLFFSGRNGLYLKPCSTFTCFPAQTYPLLSFFCLNKFHCPALCYPHSAVCVWDLTPHLPALCCGIHMCPPCLGRWAGLSVLTSLPSVPSGAAAPLEMERLASCPRTPGLKYRVSKSEC